MDSGRIALSTNGIFLYLFGLPGQGRFLPVMEEMTEEALGALLIADTRSPDRTFPVADYLEERGIPCAVALPVAFAPTTLLPD
ncbi:hypothetical protein [Streptomyces sp. NPDC018000]|uniref:hypothetical protein n=1 Tax=Streptomyces sp. NPDC018000 TaxID=3365028 RepID=UPI0037AA0933